MGGGKPRWSGGAWRTGKCCLEALGCLGGRVLLRACGFFRLNGDLFKEWGCLSLLAKVMVKRQPILVLGVSHFRRLGRPWAVALLALPFFPFPGAEVVAVGSGFSVCPRLLAPATFLEADLWAGLPESLLSPGPLGASR